MSWWKRHVVNNVSDVFRDTRGVVASTAAGSLLPGGASLGGLVGTAKALTPRAPGVPDVPGQADAAVSAADLLRQRRLAAMLGGRRSTIFAGGRGLLGGFGVGQLLLGGF